MNLRQAYLSLQRFARKHGCSVRSDQDEFGNVEIGVFDGKYRKGAEPFCVAGIGHEQDFEWVDTIKFGIRDYLRAKEEDANISYYDPPTEGRHCSIDGW